MYGQLTQQNATYSLFDFLTTLLSSFVAAYNITFFFCLLRRLLYKDAFYQSTSQVMSYRNEYGVQKKMQSPPKKSQKGNQKKKFPSLESSAANEENAIEQEQKQQQLLSKKNNNNKMYCEGSSRPERKYSKKKRKKNGKKMVFSALASFFPCNMNENK